MSKIRVNGAEVWVVYGPQSQDWLGAFHGELLNDAQIAEAEAAVVGRINEYEELNARTSAAKARAINLAQQARRTTLAATVVGAFSVAWITTASTDHSAERLFMKFVRFGDGVAGFLYLLVPLVLPVSSMTLAYRARSDTRQARVKSTSDLDLIFSVGALVAWLVTLVVVWLAD